MRRAEARTRESLIEAMGRALETVSVLDARRYFEHCGYRSVGELLYNCSRRGPSQRLTVPLPGVSRTASERLLGQLLVGGGWRFLPSSWDVFLYLYG